MIKTYKKIIILGTFLVLALFVISACNQAVGAPVKKNLEVNGNLIVVGSAAFENKQIELNEGTLQLHKLSGQGNAYACLNSNGVLFRSNNPCTITQTQQ